MTATGVVAYLYWYGMLDLCFSGQKLFFTSCNQQSHLFYWYWNWQKVAASMCFDLLSSTVRNDFFWTLCAQKAIF
jgi:hypothetical protein